MNMKTFIAASVIATVPFVANAATYYADQGMTYNGNAVAADRSDVNNASDGVASTFFSLGIDGTLSVDVSPLFVGGGSVVEVTFNNNDNYPESAEVYLGGSWTGTMFDMTGSTLLGEIFNVASGVAQVSANGATISAVGSASGLTTYMIDIGANVGKMLTLVDTTGVNFAAESAKIDSDGFDISEIAIEVVPLPAAGLMLLGGLGGLVAAKRRKKA